MIEKEPYLARATCHMCFHQCAVIVHVENGRVVKVEPDANRPFHPTRECLRKVAWLDFHNHPKRLNYPLRRKGERGEGKWEQISWGEVIDEIASKVGDIKNSYGTESIAIMGGTAHGLCDYSAWRWGNIFGTPNMFYQGKNCGEAELLAEVATYGWHTSQTVRPGITKCAIIWGQNPAESFQGMGWKPMIQAKEKGVKVIVVDPRFTKTAEEADLWLQLRPGTDGALALGMIHYIIENGLYEQEFVNKWCKGFEEIKEFVRDYTPDKVQDITWVNKDTIIEAARLYATEKPGIITRGVALCQIGRSAKSAVQAKAILRAITGNIAIEGGSVLVDPYPNIALCETLCWSKQLENVLEKRDNVSAEDFPIASLKGYSAYREAMKGVHPEGYQAAIYMICPSSYNIWKAILEGKPYPIKGLIIQGGNPLITLGNASTIYKALKSEELELLVCMDFFMTPSAMLADYVLPAADWLERPNLNFFWGLSPLCSTGEQSIEPLYERHNDYQFWRDLGERLGQGEYWPDTVEGFYDLFLEPTGMSFKEYVSQEKNWQIVESTYEKYKESGFATFSGKVELVPSIFKKMGYDPLPTYEEPARSPMSKTKLFKEYPLILITGSRVRNYFHSMYREEERLRKTYPNPKLQIHPQTANDLGIKDGDAVYIETPEGRVKQVAQLDEGLDHRVVHADAFWWFPEEPGTDPCLFGVWESNINAITPDDATFHSYAGDNPFRALLCKVYKAKEFAAP